MRALLLIGCLFVGACSSSTLVQAAKEQPPEEFRRSLPGLLAAEPVSEEDAREVARIVAAGEITSARGDSGERALEAVAPCARELDDALGERARQGDDRAAQASLIRLEANLASPVDVGRYLRDEHPWWRAVAARTLTAVTPAAATADDAEAARQARAATWRRQLLTDSARIVRRAALEAAGDARDRADVDDLLEAARLDPEPALRVLAIDALGALGDGGVARRLWDVWNDAGTEERVAVVRAWARLAPLDSEAGSALVRATDGAPSLPLVAACVALIGGRAPAEAPEAAVTAAQVLGRAVESGSPSVRVAAIDGSPGGWPALREAIVKALEAPDPDVAAAAASWLLGTSDGATASHRAKSLARLRALAGGVGPGAERARRVLVERRDASVSALVSRDAKAASAVDRARAASAWVQLGEHGRAVAMLADADARVRASAACALLRGPNAEP